MSKKTPSKQSNTLFNYFNSPKEKEPTKTAAKIKKENDPDEEEVRPRKRIRNIVDSDSENENDTPNTSAAKIEKQPKKRKISSASEESDEETPKEKKLPKGRNNQTNNKSDNKTSKSESKAPTPPLPEVIGESHTNWLHNRLEFLKPNKIRDKNKKRPDDPDYDPRTLFVPEDYLNSLTPAMRQWWILKSQHMDCVLFFKVGKFYELYHMDAVIGVIQLGFSYMKGEFAHSGFPESAYAKMASELIEKGFKVARVEQTETPEMMADRCKLKKATKFDKVVKREICQITTKATCVYNAQLPQARSNLPCYMYAVAVKKTPKNNHKFGVCFIDTSIGVFHLSEFVDDKHCSKLLALFAEYPPGLFLTERGSVVTHFTELLRTSFKDVRKETLSSAQFYSAEKTLQKLSGGHYFKDKDGNFEWPPIFKEIADESMPKLEYELAIKCLGGCMWYLEDSELDLQILSMKKFELYNPHDLTSRNPVKKDYLVLDATTIHNLSLLGGKGSLQNSVNFCQTHFGKRLLQQWICRPLCDVDKIKQRQDAVQELWNNPSLLKSAQGILKSLPDLERQVTKIHAYGNKFCSLYHPDSRAIFYEAKTYSKRKIQDLLQTLRGFETLQEIQNLFKGCESRLLRKLTQYSPDGMNIDLQEHLDFFKTAFDQQHAETEGKIIPKRGVDDEYDRIDEEIDKINKKLDRYLQEQCNFFGCKVVYFGSDKKRYQLEIPEQYSRKVTSEYQLEGTKKGNKPCKRYSTERTKALLSCMLKAESERAKVILDLNRRIFEKFSERRQDWEQVIMCVMILDVLSSFAEYSRTYSQEICMPLLRPFCDNPELIIDNGRHPCIPNTDTFVPNDTKMGIEGYPAILLLTGPNMGGKSTLMRQIALITVMAQMGCMVPASRCEFAVVDRIFTRLGAKDDIIQNQSTFFVELSEASSILKHASIQSLVLVDELGRGTSTHDGNAIATAYVRKLIEINCRTIFSTHYHTLVDHFVGRSDVQLGHMACMVENDDDPTEESVTFLYKMVKGKCPKSYGFNAARLAGLNSEVVARGRKIAEELERKNTSRDIFTKLFAAKASIADIRNCLLAITHL